MKTASVLSWLTGLGFGLPGVYGIQHYARHGTVARFMGFPTYGEGPFERAGIKTGVPLLSTFVAVCAPNVSRVHCSGAAAAVVRF